MALLYRVELILSYLLYYTGIYGLRRKLLERRGAAIVLVYHRVLSGQRRLGETTGEYSFEGQMQHIQTHCIPTGWQEILHNRGRDRGLKVLVTFDDGYRDNFVRVLPILEKYGIRAVFFVVTNFVFNRQPIDQETQDDEAIFPSMDELRRAKRSPYITYGNHTASHPIVSTLSAEECERELFTSQQQFLEKLDVEPEVFAYPRGRNEDVTRTAVPFFEKLNIQAAFTMDPGHVSAKTEPYFVPRIGLTHVNDDILFRVKMVGLLNPLVRLKNYLSLVLPRGRRRSRHYD